jgi:hypothetical protein
VRRFSMRLLQPVPHLSAMLKAATQKRKHTDTTYSCCLSSPLILNPKSTLVSNMEAAIPQKSWRILLWRYLYLGSAHTWE